MSDSRDWHQRVMALFQQARSLSLDQRVRLLDAHCEKDGSLRAEVESLLAHHDDPVEQLEHHHLGGLLQEAFNSETPLLPDRIGPYRVYGIIATGGMGTVYRAVQENPNRVVAVKAMRRGIRSQSLRRRFEFESQVLARLRHPGIAQVYDAGTYFEGRKEIPYFAMEYIPDARTITNHAQAKTLDTRQRLELLAKACDAVDHGHKRGVIHRDLKPSNILVDRLGHLKIIDFGIARVTDSDLALTTVKTDARQLLGTIQYMSPEQCAGSAAELDIRSDI